MFKHKEECSIKRHWRTALTGIQERGPVLEVDLWQVPRQNSTRHTYALEYDPTQSGIDFSGSTWTRNSSTTLRSLFPWHLLGSWKGLCLCVPQTHQDREWDNVQSRVPVITCPGALPSPCPFRSIGHMFQQGDVHRGCNPSQHCSTFEGAPSNITA